VDEVGRGAWAGPVTVCAVIVRSGFPAPPGWLTDSKRLGPTPHHRLSWSYLDDLPTWRHLKRPGPTSRASCPCYDLGCRDEASDANTTVELR
jgi:Ribonuclease HII